MNAPTITDLIAHLRTIADRAEAAAERCRADIAAMDMTALAMTSVADRMIREAHRSVEFRNTANLIETELLDVDFGKPNKIIAKIRSRIMEAFFHGQFEGREGAAATARELHGELDLFN